MPAHPMLRLDVFIGVWNTTGDVFETEAGPAGSLVATDIYRWLPGRRFIAHDVDARFDGRPARSMKVIGFDPRRRRHFATSYDDQGTTETFEVALEGRRWHIDGPSLRFRGAFDARKLRLQGLWERRAGKSRWQPWIALELRRA